ncbi:hypothetical protein P154DRAFT_546424 [Amniculicola lignicola CBS 123094]|uniref:Endonuclease/exonuclease/phosphatase domain-containing protein n=1 Tax=Amniculicola lignicola CBS 123094 TaxID=1392246 RepID=A0A6A5WBM8_9PLEO|nr:hypothetical protein P154DRAFT_546424 [Amniculicola lignicola CBS 123094]
MESTINGPAHCSTVSADVILLQEVSKEALRELLEDGWIRQGWYTSSADFSSVGRQAFTTVTLISKASRRLSCDILLKPTSTSQTLRLRLINVHLDYLALMPLLRPQQLSLMASYLKAASRGPIAGDFNPVLPEDEDLISKNSLVDSWTSLYPTEAGFTWAALFNVRALGMRVLRTCSVGSLGVGGNVDGVDENSPDG